jgi:hypothetical protein
MSVAGPFRSEYCHQTIFAKHQGTSETHISRFGIFKKTMILSYFVVAAS